MCLAAMAAIAPLAISRKVDFLRWDDAFFLDRAVCVDRSAYSLSLSGIHHCLAGMLKSPVMSLLLLPAGPLNRVEQLAVAPFMLAFITLGLAICLACLAFKARIPLLWFSAAAVAIWQCGQIKIADAYFLVDGAFAIIVAITMLLPILEEAAPSHSARSSIERGLLWGAIATLGALSKTTFGMFGVLIAPLMLIASFYRSGARATLQRSAGAAAVCLIPAVMFLLYGDLYITNGWRSSFGDLAQFYGDSSSYLTFLQMEAGAAGPIYWILCLALFIAGAIRSKHNRLRFVLGLAIAAVAVGYFLLVCHSSNREERFLWPAWIILPISLAACTAPRQDAPEYFSLPALTFAFSLAAVLSLPMAAHFDLQNVREAMDLLRFIKADRDVRMEVASDTQEFNINTLALAQQVGWEKLSTIDIRTVVLDVMLDKPLMDSERQIREAGYVLLPGPFSIPPAPESTNRYSETFLHLAEKCGRLVSIHPGPASALLFEMHSAQCNLIEDGN
jgi:hypothetical protein